MLSFDRVLERFAGVKRQTKGLKARCPACGDFCVSLLEGRNGRSLIKCHAGCATETILTLTDPPLSWADIQPEREQNPRRERTNYSSPPRLIEYARVKRLPLEFLNEKVIETRRGLRFLRFDWKSNEAPPHQMRVSLDGAQRFITDPPGMGVALYGEHRLKEWWARGDKEVFIAEGPTDFHTGDYINIAILGLPGATQVATIKKEHLQQFAIVTVLREPDEGGRHLTVSLAKRLDGLKFDGARQVRIFPPDIKDLNQLFIRCDADPEATVRALLDLPMRSLRDVAREDAAALQVINAKRRAEANARRNGGPPPAEVVFQWEPILEMARAERPKFPLHALGPLAPFVADVAEQRGVAVELVAQSALTVSSAANARRFRFAIGDRQEGANIYTLAIAPPNAGKSRGEDEMSKPLRALEAEFLKDDKKRIRGAKLVREQKEARVKAIQAAMPKVASDRQRATLQLEAEDLLRALDEDPALNVVPRELLADDATGEKITRALDEQGGAIAIISSEATIFETLGRYLATGAAAYIDPLLKGFSGDFLKVGRVSHSSIIPLPRITIGVATQPVRWAALIKNPTFRYSGLLPRFLLVYLTEEMLDGEPERVLRVPRLNPSIRNDYHRLIRTLASFQAGPEFRNHPPLILNFKDKAAQRLLRFQMELQHQMRGDGPLADVADWAGKLDATTIRIAGNLELAKWAGSLEYLHLPQFGTTVTAFLDTSEDNKGQKSASETVERISVNEQFDSLKYKNLPLFLNNSVFQPCISLPSSNPLTKMTEIDSGPQGGLENDASGKAVTEFAVVNFDPIGAAIELARYACQHAISALTLPVSEGRWGIAHQIKRWLEHEPRERFSTREAHRKFHRKVSEVAKLRAALDLLAEHNIIASDSEAVPPPKNMRRRGRPPENWLVNPMLYAKPAGRVPGEEG